ncbi:DgyrCDS14833 [Dimorphilus gyrociliatus]|uniref:DgyrCDS14833 n=1 Tax=Dimorphilus gyrociliatus TaxID=2664684 RepID=A0A7I8WF04_9ANNE|nr:DgyrCDS14833 [Dimorphilus gyrociliatus]
MNKLQIFKLIATFQQFKLVISDLHSGCPALDTNFEREYLLHPYLDETDVKYYINPIIENDRFVYGTIFLIQNLTNKTHKLAFGLGINDYQHKKLCRMLGYDDLHFVAEVCDPKNDFLSLLPTKLFGMHLLQVLQHNAAYLGSFCLKCYKLKTMFFNDVDKFLVMKLICLIEKKVHIPLVKFNPMLEQVELLKRLPYHSYCPSLSYSWEMRLGLMFTKCKWTEDLFSGCLQEEFVRGYLYYANCIDDKVAGKA